MPLTQDPISIVVTHPSAEVAQQWCEELGAQLPRATIIVDGQAEAAGSAALAHYAVGWLPDSGFFDRHRSLKAFFYAGAGVEQLIRDPLLPADLPLYRLEDAGMGWQMAEYCAHEVSRIRTRSADYEAQQASAQWRELAVLSRESLPVGVFGYGMLGQQVAARLAMLGYPVAAHSRSPATATVAHQAVRQAVELFHGPAGLHRFLARTKVLILLAPLTPQTGNIIDADALARLQGPAWLINVARGALVDDQALMSALDSGQLAGATLDVFRTEPLPADHPFWRHSKIRVTPHVSAMTLVADSARQVADKIDRFVHGLPVVGQVDRQRGY